MMNGFTFSKGSIWHITICSRLFWTAVVCSLVLFCYPVHTHAQGTWQQVGTAGFSAGATTYTSLAFDSSGTPYVAYQDGSVFGKASVMKFSAGSWQQVGTAGFSAGLAFYTSLAFDSSGTPYVAYQDVANGGKASVMKFPMPVPVKSASVGGVAERISLTPVQEGQLWLKEYGLIALGGLIMVVGAGALAWRRR